MNYIYNARFQPFNITNLKELIWLCDNIKNSDNIIIGIVNPNPQLPLPADVAINWTRFQPKYNVLSYWQRVEIIKKVLTTHALSDRISEIVPLPRPSVNMREADNYLPPKDKRIICVCKYFQSEAEEMKSAGLLAQGEKIFEIPTYSFEAKFRGISPEIISCLVSLNNNNWKDMVPNEILEMILDQNFIGLVKNNLAQPEAKESIEKVFNAYSDVGVKQYYWEILKEYLDVSKNPFSSEKTPLTAILSRILDLCLEKIEAISKRLADVSPLSDFQVAELNEQKTQIEGKIKLIEDCIKKPNPPLEESLKEWYFSTMGG